MNQTAEWSWLHEGKNAVCCPLSPPFQEGKGSTSLLLLMSLAIHAMGLIKKYSHSHLKTPTMLATNKLKRMPNNSTTMRKKLMRLHNIYNNLELWNIIKVP